MGSTAESARYGKCWALGQREMGSAHAGGGAGGLAAAPRRAADALGHARQQADARCKDDCRGDAYRRTRRRRADC